VNGSSSEIRDNYSSMLGKNSPESPWLMFLLSEGRFSSISHRYEWKNGQDDSVCIMILFMQVDIRWYDCYGDCMSLDSSCMLLWWM
jgi:hypothetical protein